MAFRHGGDYNYVCPDRTLSRFDRRRPIKTWIKLNKYECTNIEQPGAA